MIKSRGNHQHLKLAGIGIDANDNEIIIEEDGD